MLTLNVNHLYFKDLGDSQWWRHLNFNFDYWNIDFNQQIEFGDSNKLIYEPNISQELGNKGIDIVKDGSVVKIIPPFTRVAISTVQEPICVTGDYFYHENININ